MYELRHAAVSCNKMHSLNYTNILMLGFMSKWFNSLHTGMENYKAITKKKFSLGPRNALDAIC